MSEQGEQTEGQRRGLEHREPVWLTVREYADQRKLSISTVRRMIAAGSLITERVSPRSIRIRLTRVVRSMHERS